MSGADFRTWLKKATLQGIEGDEVSIRLPTRFDADRVRKDYGARILDLWRVETPAIQRVAFTYGAHEPRAGPG